VYIGVDFNFFLNSPWYAGAGGYVGGVLGCEQGDVECEGMKAGLRMVGVGAVIVGKWGVGKVTAGVVVVREEVATGEPGGETVSVFGTLRGDVRNSISESESLSATTTT
jgi:hypothetical protein